jgi:hypothetical protein
VTQRLLRLGWRFASAERSAHFIFVFDVCIQKNIYTGHQGTGEERTMAADAETDAVAAINASPPTEAERQYARDKGLIYPGMFDGEEMSAVEIAQFWLKVRADCAAQQQ